MFFVQLMRIDFVINNLLLYSQELLTTFQQVIKCHIAGCPTQTVRE